MPDVTPITPGNNINWNDLIANAKENLKRNIENLSGATIPTEFQAIPVEVQRGYAVIQVTHGPAQHPVIVNMTSDRNWTTVRWETVEQDFNDFLASKNLINRGTELISTRLILNFYENLSLFYANRLVIVYSAKNNVKRLYYYNDGSSYSSWTGTVANIESPVQDLPITAEEANRILNCIDLNLKNKVKTYNQTYTFTTTSSSSCSSCSSSSSSSSSCWTIIHQDLSLL